MRHIVYIPTMLGRLYAPPCVHTTMVGRLYAPHGTLSPKVLGRLYAPHCPSLMRLEGGIYTIKPAIVENPAPTNGPERCQNGEYSRPECGI